MVLIGINIFVFIILSILINKYQMWAYRGVIYITALLVLNAMYFEFHKKYISRLFMRYFQTSLGRWIIHTLFLIITTGIVFITWNTITASQIPKWKHIKSEVTGILSTIDLSATGETLIEKIESTSPWTSLGRYLGIWNSGEDVLQIQKYLREKGYYGGKLSGEYDAETAKAINDYIWETTGEVFTRSEFGEMKLAFLKKLSDESKQSLIIGEEATGSISTDSTGSTQIQSIESMDSWATATVQDGKITVQVVSSQENASSSDNWEVQSVLKNTRWAGGLQWVVISPAVPSPVPGSYKNFQNITFSAEGASWIFITADGSDPSCQWKWLTKIIRPTDTITIKAISCFGWNKIRWPISSYTFTLKK